MRAALRSILVAAALLAPAAARAQWVTTHEQFYLQAPHNWVFRNDYQGADRLFNAFDYGHAILYEKLWTRPGASSAAATRIDRIAARISGSSTACPPRRRRRRWRTTPCRVRSGGSPRVAG